jgi:hypothetical protein
MDDYREGSSVVPAAIDSEQVHRADEGKDPGDAAAT